MTTGGTGKYGNSRPCPAEHTLRPCSTALNSTTASAIALRSTLRWVPTEVRPLYMLHILPVGASVEILKKNERHRVTVEHQSTQFQCIASPS